MSVSVSSGGGIPQNAQAIMDGLIQGGLTPTAAAAVAGNIYAESGGDPNSVGSGGCGLIGWTPCPWDTSSLPSLSSQIQSVLSYVNSDYPGGIAALNQITDPTQAGESFAQYGERCAACGYQGGSSQLAIRGANALATYQAYVAGSLGAAASQGSAPAGSSSSSATLTSASSPTTASVTSSLESDAGYIVEMAVGVALIVVGLLLIFHDVAGIAAVRAVTGPLGRTTRTRRTRRQTSERDRQRHEDTLQRQQQRSAESRYRRASAGRSHPGPTEADRRQWRREGFPSDHRERRPAEHRERRTAEHDMRVAEGRAS